MGTTYSLLNFAVNLKLLKDTKSITLNEYNGKKQQMPLEVNLPKCFVSSFLKEKNMCQIVSKILFLYTKIMGHLTPFNRS